MEYDTAIIGGGIAGLYVAEQLAKRATAAAPMRIGLFEKNTYFGGRVYTFRDAGLQLQYESGAGRIHRSHRRTYELVRRFRLHTYPIRGASYFEDMPNPFAETMAAVSTELQKHPLHVLQTHTIAQLIPKKYHAFFLQYPYWAEIHMLRADVALRNFAPGGVMLSNDFFGISEGNDALVHKLASAARRAGAHLHTSSPVQSVTRNPHSGLFELQIGTAAVRARRVVFATCRCSLGQFRLLRDLPLLRQLGTSPLLRIYAVYPVDRTTGRAWFAGIPKTVTAGPLRFVIPINPHTGLIMISYTDGDDTRVWERLEGAALLRAIQRQVRHLWPDRSIPDPVYLKKHYWSSGCTYWLPGAYSVEDAAAQAAHPMPGVYICGESVSAYTQAWVEGALETAEQILESM